MRLKHTAAPAPRNAWRVDLVELSTTIAQQTQQVEQAKEQGVPRKIRKEMVRTLNKNIDTYNKTVGFLALFKY